MLHCISLSKSDAHDLCRLLSGLNKIIANDGVFFGKFLEPQSRSPLVMRHEKKCNNSMLQPPPWHTSPTFLGAVPVPGILWTMCFFSWGFGKQEKSCHQTKKTCIKSHFDEILVGFNCISYQKEKPGRLSPPKKHTSTNQPIVLCTVGPP